MKSGSRFILLWWILLLGGGAGWGLLATGGHPTVWRALLVAFHYIVPMAAGLVVWSAIAVTCRGRWMLGNERAPLAAASFGPAAILLTLLLWAGVGSWSPWHITELHQGKWLSDGMVMGRNLALLVLFWSFAFIYARRRIAGTDGIMAPWLVLVYALVFSMVGFDLVMALDPHWYSTLAGGYYFMTGLYRAVACWILFTAFDRDADPKRLHDLGNALLAFCIFSTYFMYSHLLPIWYENLPEEMRFVGPRLFTGEWGNLSLILVGWVYLSPIVLLLWKNGKKKRGYMIFVALWVLAGAWVERWWLVAPTLQPDAAPSLADAAAAALVIGLLGVSMQFGLRRAGSGGRS